MRLKARAQEPKLARKSLRNAVRHGLTAETIISALEDAEDYRAFEAAITADYDAQSTVERELVLRLASIRWRLRRATTMETGLFEIQAEHLPRTPAKSTTNPRFCCCYSRSVARDESQRFSYRVRPMLFAPR